jgi:hypothetical protein
VRARRVGLRALDVERRRETGALARSDESKRLVLAAAIARTVSSWRCAPTSVK